MQQSGEIRVHFLGISEDVLTFHMTYQNGEEKDYQVLEEGKMLYSLDYPYADIFYITIMVPGTEYIKYTGNDCDMYAVVDALH